MTDNETSQWNKGDKVMVTFTVVTDGPVSATSYGETRLYRLAETVGDVTSLHTIPESCFIDARAYELVEDPTSGHDDWGAY